MRRAPQPLKTTSDAAPLAAGHEPFLTTSQCSPSNDAQPVGTRSRRRVAARAAGRETVRPRPREAAARAAAVEPRRGLAARLGDRGHCQAAEQPHHGAISFLCRDASSARHGAAIQDVRSSHRAHGAICRERASMNQCVFVHKLHRYDGAKACGKVSEPKRAPHKRRIHGHRCVLELIRCAVAAADAGQRLRCLADKMRITLLPLLLLARAEPPATLTYRSGSTPKKISGAATPRWHSYLWHARATLRRGRVRLGPEYYLDGLRAR